jgi:hypothetical protein
MAASPCLDDFAEMKKAIERVKQADCSNIGSRVAASKKKKSNLCLVLGYRPIHASRNGNLSIPGKQTSCNPSMHIRVKTTFSWN